MPRAETTASAKTVGPRSAAAHHAGSRCGRSTPSRRRRRPRNAAMKMRHRDAAPLVLAQKCPSVTSRTCSGRRGRGASRRRRASWCPGIAQDRTSPAAARTGTSRSHGPSRPVRAGRSRRARERSPARPRRVVEDERRHRAHRGGAYGIGARLDTVLAAVPPLARRSSGRTTVPSAPPQSRACCVSD